MGKLLDEMRRARIERERPLHHHYGHQLNEASARNRQAERTINALQDYMRKHMGTDIQKHFNEFIAREFVRVIQQQIFEQISKFGKHERPVTLMFTPEQLYGLDAHSISKTIIDRYKSIFPEFLAFEVREVMSINDYYTVLQLQLPKMTVQHRLDNK